VPVGITIREARGDEMAFVKRLSVDELPDELSEWERPQAQEAKKSFARVMDALLRKKGTEVYVAVLGGGPKIAGYVWLGVSDRPFSEMKVGWIYDIQVVPSERGKGVGEALLRHALEASKRKGFVVAGLMVRANNKAAYSLYEKLGFYPEYVVMSRKEPGPISPSNS
jgi:ribosomal protein S18 acetylase RimI-like enzyme